MNQKPNIEEEFDARTFIKKARKQNWKNGGVLAYDDDELVEELENSLHQQLQKALEVQAIQIREEESNEYNKIIERELQKAREEEREACAVTVWSYLATFEDCLEPTQRTNALIQAIRLIRDRKTNHSELDQDVSK